MTMTRNFKTTAASLAACLLALAVPTASMASVSDTGLLSDTAQVALPGGDADHDQLARRGRGADDPAGHVRGGGKGRGRGADDGPRHTSMPVLDGVEFARRGADDPAGHVRGGGKGRGKDDAPNHG